RKMEEITTSAVPFLSPPLRRAIARLPAIARREGWRTIAIVLSLTIVVGDPVWAAGVADLIRSSLSHDLRDLSIPGRFGTITDKWIAPERASEGASERVSERGRTHPRSPALPLSRSPFVVLIQDLHAN